ncbi:MAG: ParB/RepB/Spo0J family partition protein [Microbacteriaceae bacterium]
MTDTTTLGTVEHIDPNTIEVETNIRTVSKPDPALVASIRQFGVLEPVVCRRDENGKVTVRMGQRRVLAAREAERPTVPAYIVTGDDATTTRLLEQFAENEHRANLTEAERAAVFQQLQFEGLSIPQIAKQTGVKRASVEAGIKVAENELAGKVVTNHAVTLDQAASMIEFEDDARALANLVATAEQNPEQFAHELQRQRDRAAREEAIEAERATLAEAGYTLLDHQPYYDDKTIVRISELVNADGSDVTPEHLAGVGEDKLAYVTIGRDVQAVAALYVRNFKIYGFKKRPGVGGQVGAMTDEQKAERKELIANNKAWDSAEVVRREWLAAFLSRKTLPKDAAAFVTVGLTAHRRDVAAALNGGNRLAATLLGLEAQSSEWSPSPVDTYAEQPGKAGHVALATVLAGMEAAIGRHTWRNPTSTAGRYLAQIEAWGYALSDVEQIVTAAKVTPGDEYDADPEDGDDGEVIED